jgi:hypothetical protein
MIDIGSCLHPSLVMPTIASVLINEQLLASPPVGAIAHPGAKMPYFGADKAPLHRREIHKLTHLCSYASADSICPHEPHTKGLLRQPNIAFKSSSFQRNPISKTHLINHNRIFENSVSL